MSDSETSTSEPSTPLEEAQAAGELTPTLKELFDKEPLELSPEDRRRLIEAMRERRTVWMAEEARAANSGKNPSWKTKGTSRIEDLVKDLADADMPAIDLSILED